MNEIKINPDQLTEFELKTEKPKKVKLFIWSVVSILGLFLSLIIFRVSIRGIDLHLLDAGFFVFVLFGFFYPVLGLTLFKNGKRAGWFLLTHNLILLSFFFAIFFYGYITKPFQLPKFVAIIFIMEFFLVIPSLVLAFNKTVQDFCKVTNVTRFYVIFISIISPLIYGGLFYIIDYIWD